MRPSDAAGRGPFQISEPAGLPSAANRGLDPAGFILPEVDISRIAPHYQPIVDYLRQQCRAAFVGDLHSLYLAGSIVKGTAVPGVSDLDAIAVLRLAPDAGHEALAREVERAVEARHPILTHATLDLFHCDDILSRAQRYDMGFFVKCLCACVDGEDLAADLPRYRPSRALARGANGNVRRLLTDRRERVATTDPATIAAICRGIMRKIIRTGFTLVMPRYRGWTSDLEPSVAIFAAYYPTQAAAMHDALALARTPSGDQQVVLNILDTLGIWLADEYDREILSRGRALETAVGS